MEECKKPIALYVLTYEEFIKELGVSLPAKSIGYYMNSRFDMEIVEEHIDCIYYKEKNKEEVEMFVTTAIWMYADLIAYEWVVPDASARGLSIKNLSDLFNRVRFIPVKDIPSEIGRRYYVVCPHRPKDALELYTMLKRGDATRLWVDYLK